LSDDILARLLVAFKAEQREHVDQIRALVQQVAKSGAPSLADLEEAFRRAHSVKGAARAVDLHPVETLAHSLETIFSRVRDRRLPLDERVLRTIALVLDAIDDWVAAYFQKKTPDAPVNALAAVEALLDKDSGGRRPVEPAPPAPGPAFSTEEALRISSRSLERLMTACDRVSAEIVGQESLGSKLRSMETSVIELELERDRIRRGRGGVERSLRQPQLQPLSRYLDGVQRGVRSLRKELRDLRVAQTRKAWSLNAAGEQLRREVRQARLVPAESVFQGLRKMVRDLARDEGRAVDFSSEGLDVQADRLVLQALKDPVMHILRNAISHGFATPPARPDPGTAAPGTVRLALRTHGNQLHLSVSDNGRGVDWRAVAEQAVKRHHLSPEEAARATPAQLSRLLFLPGFSTTRMVTDLSGRGMGLSVVAETVKRMQGHITLRSEPGAGMHLDIVVPISISSHQLLILDCGGPCFALPVLTLERLLRIPVASLQTVKGQSVAMLQGRVVPVASLARLIGLHDGPLSVEGAALPVAVLRASGGAVGVAANRFVAVVEGVVKPIRGGAEAATAFAGAIQTEDGAIVLVLDPAEMVERYRRLEGGTLLRAERAAPPRRVPTMLVVDDSVTTRTLEKSILEAHGYQVILAVDGEEALRRLRVDRADLAIVDLQMPRMDGFQLIEHMKRDESLAKIPVIIVSSLESREEKERGLALGASAYIVKRKFDHKGLLDAIRQIL
jgi:two-component system, chemotaxis family, sensor kinase CheA